MCIEVKIKSKPDINPAMLTNHAALTCYRGELPDENAKMLDLEKQLFLTGHHSTFAHVYYVFEIDHVAISTITLGGHLASPFYNTSQRSGRYCAAMFTNPDTDWMTRYISTYWPEVGSSQLKKIYDYIVMSAGSYRHNLNSAANLCLKLLKEERPFLSDKAANDHSKIAQEQLRNLLPTIFPTAKYFTVSLLGLISLYHSAHSPDFRALTQMMVNLVLADCPELAFAFKDRQKADDWSLPHHYEQSGLLTSPVYELQDILNADQFVAPSEDYWKPCDLLHYRPEMMNNSNVIIMGRNKAISVASMGQDQRHRTIKRGTPSFNGYFYLPPLMRELGLELEAREVLDLWLSLRGEIPDTLHDRLIPYGAMLSYSKIADANALVHESMKRTCFKAQEEIYSLAAQAYQQISAKLGPLHALPKYLQAPCAVKSSCIEGDRYCGRDIKQASIDINPLRRV